MLHGTCDSSGQALDDDFPVLIANCDELGVDEMARDRMYCVCRTRPSWARDAVSQNDTVCHA